MEENYKLACFDEFIAKHLLDRYNTVSVTTLEEAQNETDKPNEKNLCEAIKLFNSSDVDSENCNEAFIIINSEIHSVTKTKLEVVFSSNLLNIMMEEVSLSTSYSEIALRILYSLSYVKEHCEEMVKRDVKHFIPVLLKLLDICTNNHAVCIIENLLSYNEMRDILLENDTIDFSPIFDSLSNEENYMKHVANIISYLSTKYFNEKFQEQCMKCFLFSFDSSFNVCYSFYNYFKNVSSHKDTFDPKLYNPIINLLNINYKLQPHYLILLGNLIDTYKELIDVDFEFLVEKDAEEGRFSEEFVIAAKMFFIGVAIDHGYYELNEYVSTKILDRATRLFDSSTFYSKKWIIIAMLSVLNKVPTSFYAGIDVCHFFVLFEEMFDNEIEPEIGNRIIYFVLSCFNKYKGINQEIANGIMPSGIIPIIGEYIDQCQKSCDLYIEFIETFKSE